jgi:tripartite-type tricarboxylate transporter receptor subunit TctC
VRKINADINDILKSKEMIDFLATQGAEPLITTPDEFLDILKSDTEKWAKVVKASGVHIN